MTNGRRDYAKEYNKYHSRSEQKKHRAERNKAHRMMESSLGHNITQDVDHRTPLSKGGANARGNLRVLSRHANRSYARTRTGRMA